ncbi:putative membrane protein (plasmid) [Clostridium botulinum]|uniref:Putative membrane protein n=1 Tax=Clostridium botulinum TaxID=1491 RepID=A0A1L7JMV8_CLOBO|nr:putative membrane protein [Clostridium botulinum]
MILFMQSHTLMFIVAILFSLTLLKTLQFKILKGECHMKIWFYASLIEVIMCYCINKISGMSRNF